MDWNRLQAEMNFMYENSKCYCMWWYVLVLKNEFATAYSAAPWKRIQVCYSMCQIPRTENAYLIEEKLNFYYFVGSHSFMFGTTL